MVIVKAPKTDAEWANYFIVRYNTLRKEWGQPLGSEHLADDHLAQHAIALESGNNVIGVCRMHFNSPTEAQIRMMGVDTSARTKGVGTALIKYFEDQAKVQGAKTMVLDARDYAIKFYEKNGYTVIKPTHVLWGLIPHFWMQKTL